MRAWANAGYTSYKVIFLNPLSPIAIRNFERRTPLPADLNLLRAALMASDPATAALAALVIFHGLRPIELRDLQLTDARDGCLHLADRTVPLANPAKARVAACLDHRHRQWPNSINPHLSVHYLNAGATSPVARYWGNRHLGISAQAIRQDRIVDETIATKGDPRRNCDFSGLI